MRAEAAAKREKIERKELKAENLRNMAVDDSKGLFAKGQTEGTVFISLLKYFHTLVHVQNYLQLNV